MRCAPSFTLYSNTTVKPRGDITTAQARRSNRQRSVELCGIIEGFLQEHGIPETSGWRHDCAGTSIRQRIVEQVDLSYRGVYPVFQ